MKANKRGRVLTSITVLVAAAAFVTGCSSTSSTQPEQSAAPATDTLTPTTEYTGPLEALPTSYPETDDASLTIGFVSPNGAVELLGALSRAMETAVEAAGGEIVLFDSQAQPDLQVTQMQQLVDRGVDAIVVWPLDTQALNPVIESATQKSIPVIGIEVNPDPEGDVAPFTSQISAGADQIGFNAAREMARVAPGAEVAVAGFVVPVPYIRAQTDAVARWAQEFGLDVVAEVENQTDDVAGGMTALSGALAQHPALAGVLAYNDPTAIGGTLAARESGRTVTAIGANGGSDAFEAIQQGRLHGTLQIPVAIWAEQLQRAAYGAVLSPDEELPRTVYPAVLELITADNIGEALTFDEQIAQMK